MNLFYANAILITNTLHFKTLVPSLFQRKQKSLLIIHILKGTELRWQQGITDPEVLGMSSFFCVLFFLALILKIEALFFRPHAIVPLFVKGMPRGECTIFN